MVRKVAGGWALLLAVGIVAAQPRHLPEGLPPYPAMPDPEVATMVDIEAYDAAVEAWWVGLTEEQTKAIRALNEAEQMASFHARQARPWPPPAAEEDWPVVAFRHRLPGSAVAELREHGFRLQREQRYRQSFEAYTKGSRIPIFVTTDSLLNGFHVLLEATLIRATWQQADLLEDLLEDLDQTLRIPTTGRIPFDPASVPDLVNHAQRVLGPAMVLMGMETHFADVAVAADVAEAVRRIREADSVWLPPWLEPAESDFLAIDFRRFRPVGFHDRHPRLADHFRALEWLRCVPFRIDREREFHTFALLADRPYGGRTRAFLERLDRMDSLFGMPNGVNLLAARGAFGGARLGLATGKADPSTWVRILHLQGLPENTPIQTDIRFEVGPREVAGGNSYALRLFVPRVLPDAVLLQEVQSRPGNTRPLPSGLEWAAYLGSPWAKAQLLESDSAPMLDVVSEKWALRGIPRRPTPGVRVSGEEERAIYDRWNSVSQSPLTGPFLDEETLYARYTALLQSLFRPPEPEAPAWMQAEGWQRKNTETVLASWAQMRHSLSLIAARNVDYMLHTSMPPGFVEPNPEFFQRMADLAREIRRTMMESGVLGKPQLDWFPGLLDRLEFVRKTITEGGSHTRSRQDGENEDWMTRFIELGFQPEGKERLEPDQWTLAHWREVESKLEARLAQLTKSPATLDEATLNDPLWRRWTKLSEVAQQLESMVHKQLRGVNWNATESELLETYGETLGDLMLYNGNSWVAPRDDAPRVIGIFQNPQINSILHVGIGRPFALYVLYPWQGRVYLCRGSMLPYHEFAHADWMTDSEWRELEPTAALPVWLNP